MFSAPMRRSIRAISSSTGNKASFAKLDFNSDGVLSRGEVVGGARRFNLTAEEAGALFDELDKNRDNGAARARVASCSCPRFLSLVSSLPRLSRPPRLPRR